MGFIRDIVVVGIMALVIVIGFLVYYGNQRGQRRVKTLVEKRNLYHDQLDIAIKALKIEKDLNNSNAELALMDIAKLQNDYDEQKELAS